MLQASESVLGRAVANTQVFRRGVRNSGVKRSLFPHIDKRSERGRAGKAPKSQHWKAPMSNQRQPNVAPWVVRMSIDKADRLHRSAVEAMVQNGGNATQLSSDASKRHQQPASPGIEFCPLTEDAVTDSILPATEQDANDEATALVAALSPSCCATTSFDGITTDRKQIKLVSWSVERLDHILKLVCRDGANVGDSEGEAKLIVHAAMLQVRKTNRPIVQVNTDNADNVQAIAVADALSLSQQSEATAKNQSVPGSSRLNTVPGRDGPHTADLLAKDFVDVGDSSHVMKATLKSAKCFVTWACSDSVTGFRKRLLSSDPTLAEITGDIPSVPWDMRQACWDLLLNGILSNEKCFKRLVIAADFKAWVNGLSGAKKTRAQKMVRFVESFEWWQRLTLLGSVFSPIHRVVALLSDTDTPMSAMLPLACALDAELKVALASEDFKEQFGEALADQMLSRVSERINLDGNKPTVQREEGQRGPARRALLDRTAILSHAMDPHAARLPFDVELDHADAHAEMIELYTNFRLDTTEEEEEEALEVSAAICFGLVVHPWFAPVLRFVRSKMPAPLSLHTCASSGSPKPVAD